MSTKSITKLSIVTLAVCVVGCGIQPETLVSLREAVNTVSAQSPPGQADAERIETVFQPPYPQRVDPFSFPANAPVSDQTATSITTVAQVEILGFANVDEPRVFMRTKDLTKSLKVGETADGVEVVKINPPQVELRMGTLVWTASMFDNTTVAQ